MIRSFGDKTPHISASAYVDEFAFVSGDVTIGENVSIWPGAVLRGDEGAIVVGDGANIQDNATVHTGADIPAIIGRGVTVGHNAVLHSCTIEDNVLIGIQAVVLDNAYIEKDAIVAAGTLIPPRKRMPGGQLIKGVPGTPVRALSPEEIKGIFENAKEYERLLKIYKDIK